MYTVLPQQLVWWVTWVGCHFKILESFDAMNESRITKRIFTWFYDHSDNNWCMDIKRISTELDMLHIYDSKLFFNIRQAQE